MRKKNVKKSPLTKAQTRLLKESLKRLLGTGLIEEESKEEKEKTFLKGAFILRTF
jgi:hypothetical protein